MFSCEALHFMCNLWRNLRKVVLSGVAFSQATAVPNKLIK